MIAPFDKAKLALRNAIDDAEAQQEAARLAPSERVRESFELSDFVIQLARASGAKQASREDELREKSRLWVKPLRAITGR